MDVADYSHIPTYIYRLPAGYESKVRDGCQPKLVLYQIGRKQIMPVDIFLRLSICTKLVSFFIFIGRVIATYFKPITGNLKKNPF